MSPGEEAWRSEPKEDCIVSSVEENDVEYCMEEEEGLVGQRSGIEV